MFLKRNYGSICSKNISIHHDICYLVICIDADSMMNDKTEKAAVSENSPAFSRFSVQPAARNFMSGGVWCCCRVPKGCVFAWDRLGQTFVPPLWLSQTVGLGESEARHVYDRRREMKRRKSDPTPLERKLCPRSIQQSGSVCHVEWHLDRNFRHGRGMFFGDRHALQHLLCPVVLPPG